MLIIYTLQSNILKSLVKSWCKTMAGCEKHDGAKKRKEKYVWWTDLLCTFDCNHRSIGESSLVDCSKTTLTNFERGRKVPSCLTYIVDCKISIPWIFPLNWIFRVRVIASNWAMSSVTAISWISIRYSWKENEWKMSYPRSNHLLY